MIDADAKPIGHIPPRNPIDISRPGRKTVITALEVVRGDCRAPDPAIYRHDPLRDVWILKDGV